jgi:thiamine-monophosphate kinase
VPLPEKALISEIRRLAHNRQKRLLVAGIGDDCAVLRMRGGWDTLVTTDFSLEGVHFRRDSHSPESVGHRCVARGLSDIAAMGGEPVAVFLSLALPVDLPQSWIRRFILGLTRVAQKYRAPLAGGDTAQSPQGIFADVIVLGSVPRAEAILRSGARPGDSIFVTGELGGSAAAVVEMEKRPSAKVNAMAYPRHFYPQPRIEVAKFLREKELASAMIDTSDGLSTDLTHICEESGVGAEIDPEQIPMAQVGKPKREVSLDLALHGGEDYELLFTAPSAVRMPRNIRGVTISEIGRVTRRKGLILCSAEKTEKLEPRGWEYFRKR